MNLSATPLNPLADAPDLARRLGAILLAVAALVARRFLRDPWLLALTVPVCRWLTRAVGRLERAVARPARVRIRAARPRQDVARADAVRLPSGRGWLVRALGYEAAGLGAQMQHLLAEPATQAMLADLPALGRILRPICRMLGVTGAEKLPRPAPQEAEPPAAALAVALAVALPAPGSVPDGRDGVAAEIERPRPGFVFRR